MKISNLYNNFKITNKDKKIINNYFSQAKKEAKSDKCLICGNQCTSFCNSHTIPQFILRNISNTGKLYNAGKLINALKTETGILNCNTFFLICNNCDKLIFKDYETPILCDCELSQEILKEIALKNYLNSVYKRQCELYLYKTQLSEIQSKIDNLSRIIDSKKIIPLLFFFLRNNFEQLEADYLSLKNYLNFTKRDLIDYTKQVKRLSQKIKKDDKIFNIVLDISLDYKVPLAIQDNLSIITDFDGTIINNVFSLDDKINDLHICIFPFSDKTRIFLFCDNNNSLYKTLHQRINQMKLNEQLNLITHIIFLYSEDIFLSDKTPIKYLKNKKLIRLASTNTSILAPINSSIQDMNNFIMQVFDLRKIKKLPPILSEKI